MGVFGEAYANGATGAWTRMIGSIMSVGAECAPRGKKIKELIGYQARIDMRFPVVGVVERALGYRFMCAEAAWILEGRNDVESMRKFSKTIANFSDDGVYFRGAYGPKIVDQLTYVVDSLINDPDTRQAVINIWRENPRPTRDVPCTTNIQFFIRRDAKTQQSYLHCVDTMRSSDAWLGAPYDWFNFTMLSFYVILLMRQRQQNHGLAFDVPKPGILYFNAGSEHLYQTEWAKVEDILNKDRQAPLDFVELDPLAAFENARQLIDVLWAKANRELVAGSSTFLPELDLLK